MKMRFNEIKLFQKDFKKLARKYKTLMNDLENFKERMLAVDLCVNKNFAILHQGDEMKIIKARFFCRQLKGKTLRIIYSLNFEAQKVDFIELYFKGDKENEDKERVKNYLKNYS